MEKACSKCKLLRPVSMFHKDSNARDGLRGSCKECTKARDVEYRKKNPQKVKDRCHKYYVEHSDKIKEATRAWMSSNPDRAKEIAKKSRWKHPETAKKADQKWRASHLDVHAERQRNRRAKVRGVGGYVSKEEFSSLCSAYDNRCLRCGRSGLKLTLDHVIPISLGGVNSIENIQPLCLPCNSSKKAKSTDYRFGLSED